MVFQKRLEYGFNGYQVPPTPRAPRSARKRVSSTTKNKDQNRMCAFDLLATVARKLLLEDDNPADKFKESTIKPEEESSKSNAGDQGSCNKSFFVSEIISKTQVTDTYSGSGSGSAPRSVNGESRMLDFAFENVDCKIEDIKNEKTTNKGNNVNLIIRDDDESLDNKTFRPPTRIGDRRIRRLSASKQWKFAPKLNDVTDGKKSCYKDQRSLRDYPFKKRRLYQSDNPSDSPRKDSNEDQDSYVKLKIKSFRVPEFFIEMPETATVSSLKKTVMEAVTAIFSGEIHVGVMLQGKRIRDDDKTLLQTGICHDNKLDALGFTLEPNQLQVPPFLCPKDPLIRYSVPETVANEAVIRQEVSGLLPDSPMKSCRSVNESDHDSVDCKMASDSRALVAVPAMTAGALAVVPVRKSKRAEVAQRRIRRPFTVSEVEALVEAVEKLGTGRWRDVKLRAFDDAKHRTYVDLKDKWKTLVHTARISPQQRRGEPVPQELLDRVLTAHGYWSHHQAKHQPQTETNQMYR